MNIKKIIIGFTIFLLSINITNAYNSNDIVNISVNNIGSWTSIYTVPTGKDLVIKSIIVHDIHKTDYIDIRNSTGVNLFKADGDGDDYTNISLIIKDDLQVIQSDVTDTIEFFGFLVSEDEDIENLLNGINPGINKNLFTKEDLEFIYVWEFIAMTLIGLFKFFDKIILINKKNPIKIF